jgi:hypothetical protein
MSQKEAPVNRQILLVFILPKFINPSHYSPYVLKRYFRIGPHALKGILQIILDSDFEIETYSVISF